MSELPYRSRWRPFVAIATTCCALLVVGACLSSNIQHHQGALSWHDRSLLEEEQYEVLFPLSSKDVAGFILACCGLMLAAGGGIGGGGILVPLYILIIGFDARHAIPLSNVTVFGGAVANTMLNWSKRHPLVDRPLIDWDLILIMEPMTMTGALVGANLNKLLPQYIIIILLLGVLSLTAAKTVKKAQQLHNQEQYELLGAPISCDAGDMEMGNMTKQTKRPKLPRRRSTPSLSVKQSPTQHRRTNSLPLDGETFNALDLAELVAAMNEPETVTQTASRIQENSVQVVAVSDPATAPKNQSSCSYSRIAIDDTALPQSTLLDSIIDSERRAPIRNVVVIFGLFLTVLIVNILKGGGALPSPIGIQCGSSAFWMAELFLIMLVLAVTFYARVYLLRKARTKSQTEYKYADGDIRWNPSSTLVYPLLCGFAGFVAGLFGIGGGIIKGPVMLALGVHPAVASATSACMILFTSFTATTSFLVFGMIIPDYAVFCLVMGFVATIVGQTGMSYLVKKYKRNSYIAFCIAFVVLLSAVCMALESFVSLVNGEGRSISGLCSSHIE